MPLAEIELALRRLAEVEQAVVVARDSAHGEKVLVAYITVGAYAAPSVAKMRRELGRVLPEPMIPTTFVTLDAFPLNGNGKVDRRSLPPPPRTRPVLDTPMAEPLTATECEVAAVWVEAFDFAEIGVDDDFFALGGAPSPQAGFSQD